MSETGVRRKALWAAAVAPFAAWTCQGALGLLVTVEACHRGNTTLARLFVVVAGGIALAIAVGSGLFARRALRRLGAESRPYRVEGTRNDESIALWALCAATLIGLAVIWTALPSLLMDGVCRPGG